jgi:hypothetical protein
MLAVGPTEPTYRYEAEEHERHSTHVDSCSPEVGEHKPAKDAADNVACGKRNVDVECLEFREACSFEKNDREAENCIATENLGGPNDTVLDRRVSTMSQRGNDEGLLTISVRRRLVPWKHSIKLAFAVSAFSNAVVCLI